ncbi:MAG: MlaD family protein [Thermodesulfobacteriota bacterium]|nr:MlaD family protein [Thermodesulfobacteriota bacterium]
MTSQKTKFAVGLFVIVGLVISFVSIVWLGMSHYFEKGQYYIAFFDESVQGLDKDSPVKYRGVSVGRVKSISVAADSTLIQVVLKMETEFRPAEELIAQLKSVGITGIMFVELDQKKMEDRSISLQPELGFQYPVIATKPSEIKQLIGGISDVLKQINSLDIPGISSGIKSTLDEIKLAAANLKMEELSSSIKTSLDTFDRALISVDKAAASFNALSANTDHLISANEKELSQAIAEFNQSMKNANLMVAEAAGLIKNTDSSINKLMLHLIVTLQNIEKASESLSKSLEVIADQPSRLIFGDPLPPRKVEAEQQEH